MPLPGHFSAEIYTYVNAADIKVAFGKTYLTDAADVEQYVDAMKKNLLEQIQAGKKVIV